MNEQNNPRDEMEKARQKLERQAAVNEIGRELSGEYEETFTDEAGARYYLGNDESGNKIRVYLGPDELPPKTGGN